MLTKLKDRIAKKIISLVSYHQIREEKEKWRSFVSQPNIRIHDSFKPQDATIFKGKSNEYGNIFIHEQFFMREYCSILVFPGAELSIGKNVFFNNSCSINCLEKVEIGNNTLFGEGVKLYDHNHLINYGPDIIISKDEFKKAPITIGKNCWIASNVVILKGVTIGDNSVIGAGCIIHQSVPANSIVKNNQTLIVESV